MKPDYSKLYNIGMDLHAGLPYCCFGGKALPPLRASLMLTYKCNLSCKMCFQKEIRNNNFSVSELSYEEIVNIIDQMQPYTLITLTGGEPFIRLDISEIIKYACKKNFCNILTNATLIDEDDIFLLIESKVRLLGISIDGMDKRHEEIRGVKGCFEKTISTIRLLQNMKQKYGKKYPLIDIKTMILGENINEIYEIAKLAVELNADFLTVSFPFGKYPFSPKSVVDINQLKKTNEWEKINKFTDYSLQMLNKLKEINKIKIRFYPEINTLQKDDLFALSSFKPCKMPWSHLWISPYGEVFPCLPYAIGNVRQKSINELWNCDRFKNFRNTVKSNCIIEGCYGCCYLKSKR